MAKDKEKKQQSTLSSIVEFVFLLTIVFLVRTFIFGLYVVPTGSMETTMLVGERFLADKFSYNFRKPRRGEIIAFNDPEFRYSANPVKRLFERYMWGPANWTKRVIGIPGDTVKGVIENGKPVIYLNGEKLSEPYINAYPLIHVWKQDISVLRAQIDYDLQRIFRNRRVDQSAVDQYIMQRLAHETTWRSYNSAQSYDKQDFYRINEKQLYRGGEDGALEFRVPGTPITAPNQSFTPDETRNNWTHSDVFFIKLGANEYWCQGDNRLGSHDCRFFGPVKEEEIHGRIVFCIFSSDSDESWWIIDLIKHPIDFWTRMRWSRCLSIMR